MGIKRIIAYPFRKLKRYRVSRGYSVHSPFAFYFITKVLRERLHYYCFKNEIITKEERLLFRVANFFRPTTICLIGDCPVAATNIILKACPNATFVDSSILADFTYIDSGEIPADATIAYCAKSNSTPSDAMTFTNGHTLIAVRRKSLPHQHFTLSF